MSDLSQVANPGSTLGEAVGALVEKEVNRLMRPIAEEYGCVYVTAGKPAPRTARTTKLLMQDKAGNKFQVDAVIATRRLQPLILINLLYSREEQHDFDKCKQTGAAYHCLRRAYPAICRSIVVLVGSWNTASKAALQNQDITFFEVGYTKITSTLAHYRIEFGANGKEPEHAVAVWQKWKELSNAEYDAVGYALLKDNEPELQKVLRITLNKRFPRKTRLDNPK